MTITILHTSSASGPASTPVERVRRLTTFGPKSAILMSAFIPLLMGAGGFPLPTDAPAWLSWALSAAAPLLGWSLLLGARVVSAYLRSRAATIRKQAQDELDDGDPANDRNAVKKLATAAGIDAAADVLEQRKPE